MKSGRKWRPDGLSIALLALLTTGVIAAPLHAQILYGSIVGVVQDASGSTIPAATVTDREQRHQSHPGNDQQRKR